MGLATLPRRVAVVVLLYFFLIPVVRLAWLSLSTPAGVGVDNYRVVLADPATWDAVGNTMYVSVASTLIAVVLGVAVAWLVAYTNIRATGWLQPLILMPLILPPFVVTLAWAEAFGPAGLATALLSLLGIGTPISLYNLGGISFVLGITHYPIVYLLSLPAFRRIPCESEQAARACGAGRLATWRTVTLVGALPGIAGGTLLAFLASLDNFGVPAFLGIPAGITVLSTEIYQQVVGFGPSAFFRAGALAVLLAAIALVGTLAQALVLRRNRYADTVHVDRSPRVILRRGRVLVEMLTWTFTLATIAIPVLSMVASSLSRALGVPVTVSTASLSNYRFLLADNSEMRQAILTSVTLAVLTMVICAVLGTYIAAMSVRRPGAATRLLDSAVSLPFALPGIVTALAIIFAWVQPLPGYFPGVYGTSGIILIAYVTRFTFYQVRSSAAALAQLGPSLDEAARASGAGPMAVWGRILLPLMAPGIAGGAALVLLTALSELTVSSLLYSASSKTIGVVIFSYQQAGDVNYATAAATLVLGAYPAVGVLALAARLGWRHTLPPAVPTPASGTSR